MNQKEKKPGSFVNFVLLEQPAWDKEDFLRRLEQDWQITRQDEPAQQEDEQSLVFYCRGAMVSLALMPTPVPGEEAEYWAAKNYFWPGGVEQVKKHKAHLVMAVVNMGLTPVQSGQLLVKLVVTCCRQGGVLGIYANEVVYQPDFYLDVAEGVEKGEIPLLNLVWFGLHRNEKGLCGYTSGLKELGYDEIEVLDSAAPPSQLSGFLAAVSHYVVRQNVTLKPGETIGMTAEQRLPISKGPGQAVQGESLKISFPG